MLQRHVIASILMKSGESGIAFEMMVDGEERLETTVKTELHQGIGNKTCFVNLKYYTQYEEV